MPVALEFSRPVDLRALPRHPIDLVADSAERAALARRFAIVAIDVLEASATLEQGEQGVDVCGKIRARLIQPCAISGEDVTVQVASQYRLRFVPELDYEAAMQAAGDEVELAADDLDTIAFAGSSFDLGEAIAQTLALEIDPYIEGPGAQAARTEYGLSTPQDSGPFAALKALQQKNR